MSIMSKVFGSYKFLRALWFGIASPDPIRMTAVVFASMRALTKPARTWYLASGGVEFDKEQRAQRAYDETLSRLTLAR